MVNNPNIKKHISACLLLVFLFYIIAFAQSAIVGTYMDFQEQSSTPTTGQISGFSRAFIDTSGNIKVRRYNGTVTTVGGVSLPYTGSNSSTGSYVFGVTNSHSTTAVDNTEGAITGVANNLGVGLFGQTAGGTGVLGYGTSSGAKGIWGYALYDSSAYAGWFDGRVKINGQLDTTTTTNLGGAVNVTGTTTLATSLNGYLYATNGVVSTPHTGTPTVTLGSDLTAGGYNLASVSLLSGSTDLHGFIVVNPGAGIAQIETITVNSLPSVNDTLRVFRSISGGTITFTFTAGASSGTSIHIEADTTTQAATIATRLNANAISSEFTATSLNNVVTITRNPSDVNGNGYGGITISSQTVGTTLTFAITTPGLPINTTLASMNLATFTFNQAFASIPFAKSTVVTAITPTVTAMSLLGVNIQPGLVGVNTQTSLSTSGFTLYKDNTNRIISSKSFVIYYELTP